MVDLKNVVSIAVLVVGIEVLPNCSICILTLSPSYIMTVPCTGLIAALNAVRIVSGCKAAGEAITGPPPANIVTSTSQPSAQDESSKVITGNSKSKRSAGTPISAAMNMESVVLKDFNSVSDNRRSNADTSEPSKHRVVKRLSIVVV